MKSFFEICKCRNGFLVFDENRHNGNRMMSAESPCWAFETLDAALEFIKKQFSEETK